MINLEELYKLHIEIDGFPFDTIKELSPKMATKVRQAIDNCEKEIYVDFEEKAKKGYEEKNKIILTYSNGSINKIFELKNKSYPRARCLVEAIENNEEKRIDVLKSRDDKPEENNS